MPQIKMYRANNPCQIDTLIKIIVTQLISKHIFKLIKKKKNSNMYFNIIMKNVFPSDPLKFCETNTAYLKPLKHFSFRLSSFCHYFPFRRYFL